MLNVKQLFDDAVAKLPIGEKIELRNLSKKDADSLRVKLSRELTKMSDINKTLSNAFWVSKTAQEDPDLYTVSLGRGKVKGLEIRIVNADGEARPYEEGFVVQPKEDSERRRRLMEQDGVAEDCLTLQNADVTEKDIEAYLKIEEEIDKEEPYE
jgi:hypothetical protein